METTRNPEYLGAVIDACEDAVTAEVEHGRLSDMPGTVFEGEPYDRLADAAQAALETHRLVSAGCMASQERDALAMAHAIAAGIDIAIAAMDIVDGIAPIRNDIGYVKDLLTSISVAVTGTIMLWIMSPPGQDPAEP